MSDLHFDRALRGAARREPARRGLPGRSRAGVASSIAASRPPSTRPSRPTSRAALRALSIWRSLAAVDAPEAPADPSDAWSLERVFGHWRVAGAGGHGRCWWSPSGCVCPDRATLRSRCRREVPPSTQARRIPPSAGGAPAREIPETSPPELEQRADARARLDAVNKLEASRQKTSEAVQVQSARGSTRSSKRSATKKRPTSGRPLLRAGARPVAAPPARRHRQQPQVVEEAKPDAGARTESRAAADAAAAPAAKDTKVQADGGDGGGAAGRWRSGSRRQCAARCARRWRGRRSRSRLPASASASSAAGSNDPAMAAQRGRRSEPASRRAC